MLPRQLRSCWTRPCLNIWISLKTSALSSYWTRSINNDVKRSPRHYFTTEEDDLIRRRVSKGIELRDVATELDLPEVSVKRRWTRSLDPTPTSSTKRFFTKDEDDLIIGQKLAGAREEDIAKKMSRSLGSIQGRWNHVLKHKPEVAVPKSASSKTPKLALISGKTISEVESLILQRLSEGKWQKDIAAELKCTVWAVSERLREMRAREGRVRGSDGSLRGRTGSLDDEEVQHLLKRREQKVPLYVIAAELGRVPAGFATVIRANHDLRRHLPCSSRGWSQSEHDTLLTLRATGMTFIDIAAALSRSPSSVRARFHRLTRQEPPQPRRSQGWASAEVDQVLQLHNDGWPISLISSELDRNSRSVQVKLCKELKRRGCPLDELLVDAQRVRRTLFQDKGKNEKTTKDFTAPAFP